MSQFEKVLLTFLTITTQIKLYHWQTLSYPRHVASGDLYSELDGLVDKFIEALQGRLIVENSNPNYRILLSERMNKITLTNYNDNDAYILIIKIKEYLENNEFISVISRYSDLVNLKDEMLNVVNKTGYLFSLKA